MVPGPPVLVMSRMQEGEAARRGRVVPVTAAAVAAVETRQGAVGGAAGMRPNTRHVRRLGAPGGGRTNRRAANPGRSVSWF